MSTLNLNNANALYYGDTQAQKLYKGSELLYPELNTDPYYNDVLLYLKGDDFTDSSPNPKTVNLSTGSIINTSIKKYGSGSFDFRNGNSFLSINNANLWLNNFLSLTIEFWYYCTLHSSDTGILQFDGTLSYQNMWRFYDSAQLNYLGNSSPQRIFITNRPLNTWIHCAIIHDNGAYRYYQNGILQGGANPSAIPTVGLLRIGTYGSDYPSRGFIDSFRITEAIRYTSDFNPETDTYLAY
ncbi:LamG-like jellyroll fold domain-containing protein [Cyanobacterium aponinum UTEX 3221]|uniref:LamG-like jellyroll fold domain-containing protein n=1 Tax=Cyanobacterium aponinum TaxID=379064 RepID=UPI002B4C044C|nr:LamG-like jellyroll fold domain-containing protein [Cyanobacterium aponinum]WRL38822.1 LamG-like jellyroll fold domain-containing protein [Cyanobacterium aponinum UTEX 3221]